MQELSKKPKRHKNILADWDTSQVQDMWGMFNGAAAFNQPLADWDTSQIQDMGYLL